MKYFIRTSISLLCIALLTAMSVSPASAVNPADQAKPKQQIVRLTGIKVVAPKAGDSFGAGTQTTVSWTYTNLKGTVRVLLYKAGAPIANPVLISMTLTGSGNLSFNWIIDANLTPGSNYTIVVESNDKPDIKGVSAPFSILPFKKGSAPSLGSDTEPNKTILSCPEKITAGVYISENGIKTVPEGFEAGGASNQNTDFTLAKTGMENDKKCYCEYTIGDKIFTRIYAKVKRKTCHTYGPKQIILYKK